MKKWLRHIEDLKDAIERMSIRERRMVAGLGITVVVLIVLGITYATMSALTDLEEENQTVRQALRDLQQHGNEYRRQKERMDALRSRMTSTPLELNSFVEKAASGAGVKIEESAEIKAIASERLTRRGLEIRLKKISLAQLGALMQQIEEEAGHIVQITELNVRTRWKNQEELDAELVISTFEQSREETSNKKRRLQRDQT